MSFARLHNIFLLAACLVRLLFIGRAQKIPSRPRRVLVVQRAKLGDMICTTPLLRAIKKLNQNINVWVWGNKINKQILDGNNDVDGYIVDTGSIFRTMRSLREQSFDYVCLATPDFFSLASVFLAGIPCIVTPRVVGGYSPYETIPYKIMRRFVITEIHEMGQYAPLEYLRLLEPLGIHTGDTTKHLRFSDSARERIYSIFKEYGVERNDFKVCISPSAGNKIKVWEGDRFAKLADHIYKTTRVYIFVVGTQNDAKEVKSMLAALSPNTKVISLLNLLTIDELKACIASMDMMISVDTGPIYIAEAFKVPTIDIVGPMDEQEQPPIGEKHRIVKADRKAPELHIMNTRQYNEIEARRQSEAITVDMVETVFDELYGIITKK